jgi:hypothetical protein
MLTSQFSMVFATGWRAPFQIFLFAATFVDGSQIPNRNKIHPNYNDDLTSNQ